MENKPVHTYYVRVPALLLQTQHCSDAEHFNYICSVYSLAAVNINLTINMAGRPPGRVCIIEPDIISTVDEIREQNYKFTEFF